MIRTKQQVYLSDGRLAEITFIRTRDRVVIKRILVAEDEDNPEWVRISKRDMGADELEYIIDQLDEIEDEIVF